MSTLPRPIRIRPAFAAGLVLAAACGGVPDPAVLVPEEGWSPASWQSAATPRPAPDPAAPGVAIEPFVGGTELLEGLGEAEVVLSELVLSRFLGRRDLVVVDRRRYTAAVERERRGLPAPENAPETGASPAATLLARVVVGPVLGGSRSVLVRIVRAETNRIEASGDTALAGSADALAVARAAGDLIVSTLRSESLIPSTPDSTALPRRPGDPAVSRSAAVALFARGVQAEDEFRWDRARGAYEAALAEGGPDFVEASNALARVARLRLGGTLGQS